MSQKYLDQIDNNILVTQSDKRFADSSWLLWFVGGVSIYAMIIPIVILDIFLWQYQEIFFTIFQIPKMKRAEYVIFDRAQLKKLKWLQKLNCVYCEYANGVFAFARAVANQTEIYTCAIKHRTTPKGQDHQTHFHPWQDFE